MLNLSNYFSVQFVLAKKVLKIELKPVKMKPKVFNVFMQCLT